MWWTLRETGGKELAELQDEGHNFIQICIRGGFSRSSNPLEQTGHCSAPPPDTFSCEAQEVTEKPTSRDLRLQSPTQTLTASGFC